MRILTSVRDLEANGGTAMSVMTSMRELASRGHEIHVHYEQDGNLGPEFREFAASLIQGPPVMYGRRSPLGDIGGIAHNAWVARRVRPDAVYTNHFTELAWGAAVRRLTGARVVCFLREFTDVSALSTRVLTRGVGGFIVGSECMRMTWAQHGIDASRIHVVPPGVDLRDYPEGSESDMKPARERLGLPTDGYVVTFVGRIVPQKGVEVLLEAWRRMALAPDQATLVIAGVPMLSHGPEPYSASLMKDAPPGTVWLPMQRDVISVMHASDVVVVPSVWDEPFGRVVIEGMATGRPVVASRVGGIPETLDGEFERFLFPRSDAEALAERLLTLRTWRTDDPDLGRRAIAHVASRYTLAGHANGIESVLAGR